MTRMQYIMAFVFAGLTVGTGAQAETITFSESIALQPTGWTYQVFLPMFDAELGELTGAELTLNGHIRGSASYESLDAAAANIHLDFAADIILSSPLLEGDLVANLLVTIDDSAQSFDGSMDFAGPSGNAFAPLADDVTLTIDLFGGDRPEDAGGDGEEYFEFIVTSAGNSFGMGAGNLLLNFQQESSAEVSITYTYVPEPSMIGPALLAAVLLVTRRRPLPAPIRVSAR